MLFITSIMVPCINPKTVFEEWSNEFLSSRQKKSHFTTKFTVWDLIGTIHFILIDLEG